MNSFGQNLSLFDYNYKMDWNKYETEKVSKELIESIFETIKNNPYPELKYFLQNIDKFHLLDIDGDNENEIVYNGFNGSEGEMILILESSANGYQISLKVFGRIVDISTNKKPFLTTRAYETQNQMLGDTPRFTKTLVSTTKK